MFYLGIDPGTYKTGVALWDSDTDTVGIKGHLANEEVLDILSRSVVPSDRVQPWVNDAIHIDEIWCETMEYQGMPVGDETFETCIWIGEYRKTARDLGIPFRLVKRRVVRIHHCGSTRAKDSNVRGAIIGRFGYWEHGKTGLGTKKNPGTLYGVTGHAFQALSNAVYAADTEKERERASELENMEDRNDKT